MSRTHSTALTIAALGAAVVIASTLMSAVGDPLASPDRSAPPTSAVTNVSTAPTALSAEAAAAVTALETLPTVDEAAAADYDREDFGQRWADTDRNGCDQRNDTLARDLVEITTKPGTNDCVVLTGVLHDPYTGQTIAFHRGEGTSELVQIDHVVPLAWAWRQGADSWTDDQREAFANDPANLLAVDGSTNQSKGDRGPADWTPPNTGYRCAYAIQFVTVLTAYQLSVDTADDVALHQQLTRCTD